MKNFAKSFKNHRIISPIVLAVITIPVILPLLNKGFFHFSDEVHIAHFYQMYKSFLSSQVPPRMAPDMSYGFGYPLFNYYYVLPYYIGVLLYFIFGSFIFSYKFILISATFLSGLFMYLFLIKKGSFFQALTGTVVYLYLPYRAVDLYVRGALGEIFAFMFFPLMGILLYNLSEKVNFARIGMLSVVLALFILSHNLSPFMILPWFTVYYFILNKNSCQGIFGFMFALLIGVLGASYWLFPAVIESKLLENTAVFNFYDHYPFIRQLFYSKWGYGASLPGPNDDISFQVGLSNWMLIISGLYISTRKIVKNNKRVLVFTLLTISILFFMMNIRSTKVWEILGIANYIQFPWRLLLLTGFLSSYLVIYVNNKILLIILFLLSFANVIYFKPNGYFHPDDNYFLKRYFANQTIEGETESISSQYPAWLENYAVLPKWVEKRADFLPAERIYSDYITVKDYKRYNYVEYSAFLKNEEDAILNTNIYYFPGWYAYLNGKSIKPLIEEPYGTMAYVIPKGSGQFKIKWQETPLRKFFDYVSVAAIGSASVFILIPFLRRFNNETTG